MTWAGVVWIAVSVAVGVLLWRPLGPVGAGAVTLAVFLAGSLIAQRLRR